MVTRCLSWIQSIFWTASIRNSRASFLKMQFVNSIGNLLASISLESIPTKRRLPIYSSKFIKMPSKKKSNTSTGCRIELKEKTRLESTIHPYQHLKEEEKKVEENVFDIDAEELALGIPVNEEEDSDIDIELPERLRNKKKNQVKQFE